MWLLVAVAVKHTVASVPPNLESKSGATSPPVLGTGSPLFLTQVSLFILGFFSLYWEDFVKGVDLKIGGVVKLDEEVLSGEKI